MKQDGVYRYHNRNPSNDLTSRDHRIELIKKGDVRDALRSGVRELAEAPCYIILCLDAEDVGKWHARLEAGFVGGNMLLQGAAVGVGCWFTVELSSDERKRVDCVVKVEVNDVPVTVVSAGYAK